MGYNQYTEHDNNGNLKTQIDAKCVSTYFVYDGLNRLVQKSYSSSESQGVSPESPVVYTYNTATNGKGKPATITKSGVVISYNSYDAMGRLTNETKTIDVEFYGLIFSPEIAA